jgi:hypothetical protein
MLQPSLPSCPFCGETDAKLVSQSNHRSATNGSPIGLPPSTISQYRCTCGCSFTIVVPALKTLRQGKLRLDVASRFGGWV